MPSTDVYILGQKYSIKGEAPEEYIKMLAGYIDKRINEVLQKSPNITPVKAMILTTFNIADELHKLQSEQVDLTKHIEKNAELLSDLLE